MTRSYRQMAMTTMAMAALLAVAGCDRQERAPEPEPTSTVTPQGSIFREDLEDSVLPEPPLAPLRTRVSFAAGGSELTEEASADLASIANSAQIAAGGLVTLRAHADAGEMTDKGEDSAAMARGETVKAFLVENGIDEERIVLIDFGAQNPLQPNARPDGTPNEGGRAANRRVEIEVAIPEKSKPTDDLPEDRKTLAEDVAETD